MSAEQPRRRVNSRRARMPMTYYRAAREKSVSPFERKRPAEPSRRKWFIGALDLILLLFIFFGLVYAMIVRPDPKVEITNAGFRSSEQYGEASAELFKKVSNRSKITLNEQKVISDLRKRFPEVDGGIVELPLFSQRPIVRLMISPPAFFLKASSGTFVVDKKGVAVAKQDSLPDIKDLPVVTDQTNFAVTPGKQVLSAASVNFLQTLLAECKRAGVMPVSLNLPPRAQELNLTASDSTYFVKFYLGGDPLLQSGQFLAAREEFKASAKKPSSYLDVRVPGKIFYR